MPGQNEMKDSKSSESVFEVPLSQTHKHSIAGLDSESTVEVEGKLHKITITKQMYLSGTFSLKEKKFKGRVLPVVNTTVEKFIKINGAWIFMVDENVVAQCDLCEVKKNLDHEFTALTEITLAVYNAKRPRSFFPDNPRQVGISVNVINMSEIDTMKQTFQARFIMKMIWEPSPAEVETFQSKGYHSTGSGWRPRLQFPNCTEVETRKRYTWPLKALDTSSDLEPYVLSKYLLLKDGGTDPYGSDLNILPDYLMYGEMEFHGTFAELLELEAFPLDCQDFSVICWSNGGLAEQVIVPFDLFLGRKIEDVQNPEGFSNLHMCSVNLSSSNVNSAWDVQNVHISIEKQYRSNMYIIVKARRRWKLYLWRIFIPVFLLVFGCQGAFLMSIEDGGERVNLVFTAVLASVIYQLAVYGELPQIPYMTFLDWYNLFYFVLMLVILLESMIVVFYHEDFFHENLHEVDLNDLRKLDILLGVLVVLLQFVSLLVFAGRGYFIKKCQEKKLSLDYYEQVREGILKTQYKGFTLESTERKHNFENRKKKRKAYGWLRNYKAKIQI